MDNPESVPIYMNGVYDLANGRRVVLQTTERESSQTLMIEAHWVRADGTLVPVDLAELGRVAMRQEDE